MKINQFVTGVCVVIIASCFSACGLQSDKRFDWSEMELGSFIPEPPSEKGNVWENSDEEMYILIDDVSDKEYNDYLDACKEKGFIVDEDIRSGSYKAYNSDGYLLDLSHIGDSLSIQISVPMKFDTIIWPSSEAGKMLPAPKSTIGKFTYEHNDKFFVYIGNTSKEEYSEYVTLCSNNGFNVNYDKGDNHYFSDNSNGWNIALRYEGNNIMSVNVTGPKESIETELTEETEYTSTEEGIDVSVGEEPSTSDEEVPTESLEEGMRPEFKEALDSYEVFLINIATL